MSAHTVQCPICNQEFLLYDQRGFRNAGFTAHHNWCISRQQLQQGQQQNNGRHNDQKFTRASRFTMAIRRKLLPASQAPTLTNEDESRISPIPVFQESSSGYVNSSRVEPFAPPFVSSASAPQLQSTSLHHHIFQQQHQQQQQHQYQTILRQRHTCNHWETPRTIPRQTSVDTDSTCSEIVSLASGPTPILSQNIRMSNPSRVVDPDTNISLLKPSTWIDTQTTLPVIPATSSSPIIINNNPFSFASTTPTLSLENSRNGFNSANPSFISSSGVQSSHFFSTDQYTSNDVPLDYLPVDCRTAIQQQQKQQRYYRRPYQQQDDEQRYDDRMSRFTTNNDILLQCPDRFVQQNQESNDPVGYVTTTSACSLSPSTSINTIFPPTDDLYNYQGTVVYCGHCQPRDGLHDSSCALLQLFLANIMDDNEDSFSST